MTNKEKIFLLVTILGGLFLCLFRLPDTQLLIHDTARDTLKVLTIWQTKSLTLIGPPASFSLNTIKEFYFGSFAYYLALLGMLPFKFSPIGAVMPTIVLYLISIPFMYLFLKNIKASGFVVIVGTILYTVSPLTITHMRFFWNPNTIIPLSVFFWYLATIPQKKHLFETYFLAGTVAAVIFNFHYFTVIPMVVWGLMTLFRKQWDSAFGMVAGFLIGTVPLIFFELKHDFYLTDALTYNLTHKETLAGVDIFTLVGRLGEIFMAIMGIKSGEISFGTLFAPSGLSYWIIEAVLLALLFVVVRKSWKESGLLFIVTLAVTIFFAAKFSDTSFYTRYVFGAFPLAIWLVAKMLDGKYLKFILLPVLILVVFANIQILSFTPSLATGYIPMATIENIAKSIVADNPQAKYNLSENIYGDAQALALRFYVQRDAVVKPEGVEAYGWLKSIYVVSPSLEKIKSDNRWEYYASGPWADPQVTNFGEVNLHRFTK